MKTRLVVAALAAVIVFPTAIQAAGEDDGPRENPIGRFMKTGPKAPDAWCQRHALNQTTAWWRAGRNDSALALAEDGADGASLEACNPHYGQKLRACVSEAAGPDGAGADLTGHLKACMAQLAEERIKPAL